MKRGLSAESPSAWRTLLMAVFSPCSKSTNVPATTRLCPSASSGEPAEEKTGVRLGKIALVTQPLRLLVNKKRLL